MKVSTVLKASVLALAISAPISVQAFPGSSLLPGTYSWYDESGNLVGQQIIECDGTLRGPWGIKVGLTEFIPYDC